MNVSALPKKSGKIFLRGLSDDVLAAEGNIPEAEWSYITVNFADEGDRIQRESLSARRETRISGTPETKMEVSDVTTENVRERAELEVFLTLDEVHNLVRDGEEIFQSAPARSLGKEQFKMIWRGLPPMLTDAIHHAVRLSNPEWNWEA